jgi:hypothetical protein
LYEEASNGYWAIISGIITGFLTGIVASFIFLLLISRLKPKIAISPVVARGIKPQNYRIKVINKARRIKFFRDGRVLNVKARLELVTERHLHKPDNFEELDDHPLLSTQKIELRREEIFQLGPLDKKDVNETYAYRFITDEDLLKIWQNPHENTQFIRFTITATDALSNFSTVVIHEFKDKSNTFRRGNFEVGDSFNVYPGELISTPMNA